MEQFYFGDENRALFGVYHPAAGAERRPAVLLCNPFGAEAIRAHRALRVLAGRLAAAGHAVLRFDYYGSGDAGGTCEAFSLAGAMRDVLSAHKELLTLSGANRVIWVGLRLGAGLALTAAPERPKGLAGIVLWEPVINGADYLVDLSRAHMHELAQLMDMSDTQFERVHGGTLVEDQSLGFAIPSSLREEFQGFRSDALDARPARAVAIIGSGTTEEEALAARLEELKCKVTSYDDPDAQGWNSDAALNSFIVPVKTLQLITQIAGDIR